MPKAPLSFKRCSPEIYKSGVVVGVTDRLYNLEAKEVVFREVLVRGDLSGDLEYNEHAIRIVRVDRTIGLLVDNMGARGPVWQGVTCEVIG